MTFKVWELSEGEKHFAIRCTDEAGLVSGLSNPLSIDPGEGILLVEPGLTPITGTPNDTYTYEVTYVHPDTPTVHEVFINGMAHEMSAVQTNGGETIYRYQTNLPAAVDHTYYFHFAVEDPETPDAYTSSTIGPSVGSVYFDMGSSATTDTLETGYDPGHNPDEWQHRVVLADSLIAAVTEVTQSEWTALGFANPSQFQGPNRPVDSITWLQAVEYCNALSTSDGLTPAYVISGQQVDWNRDADGWRLPTEAEWEWLARADSQSSFALGTLTAWVCNMDPVLDDLGWYCGSNFADFPSTSDVAQKTANGFGLYDMHGNVMEWCWDWFGDYQLGDPDGDGVVVDPTGPDYGTQRVVRGGSWYSPSEDCRSARRSARYPDSAEDVVGMRVVRTQFNSR
jgi:formylglycine-generating enzyme required for sulfatase activity